MLDTIFMFIKLLGGIAMLYYGMELMGDGLKQSSGGALKNVLGKLTQNVVFGVITGALVTGIIQSSMATIVLTVGLIGAGILTLKQAVSIVMGANIGTTITAQLVRLMDIESTGASFLSFLEPEILAPIALLVGIILYVFVKKETSKNIGLILLGFGILFMGIIGMKDAVKPLADSQLFVDILSYFSKWPILGIACGLVMTVLIQSSSAMIAIVQGLSTTGVLNFNMIYPIIMGSNLGTCVTTAMVCCVGSSKDAKRTGIVHIIFNTVGTILFMIVLTIIKNLGGFAGLWESTVDSGSIANFQTLFNVITAVALIPFAGLLVKLACFFVKDKNDEKVVNPEIAALDSKLMISPTVALAEVAKVATNMATRARDNVILSFKQFSGYDDKVTEYLQAEENRLDFFTDRADNYLIELSANIETEKDNRHRNMLMQCVRDIERIGDHAVNLSKMAKKMHEDNISFSETARKELEILEDAIEEILRLTIEALDTNNEYVISRIEPLEEVIDDMVLLLKTRHTDRVCQGKCAVDTGLVFMEVLTNFERIADQCSNIGVQIMSRKDEEIMKNHHKYLHELHHSSNQSYLAEQENRRSQYVVPLENIKF